MKKTTRLFSLLLSVVMLICIIPQSVLAEIGEMISGNNSEATNQSFLSNNDTTADAFVYVFGEVIEKRTETTKTFRMSDGSLVAADYGKTIHFADDNGNWQDYDNTLSYSNASSADSEDVNGYGIAKSNISFKLANNSNSSNLLKITKDDYKIGINLVDADKSKAIEVYETTDKAEGNDINSVAKLYKFSSGAIYKDILPSTDLEYIISGGSIKENIIVKETCESYTYTFELKLKGLVPALCEDGSISLNDEKTDEPVLVIPKGYMYDANGECSEEVAYSIVHKNGKKYTLTVTADSEWINADERSFPVTIDPTVEAYKTTVTTFDTYISQQSPSANYYKKSTVLAGYYGSDISKENHVLIRAKELPELPESAVIVDARMHLAHLDTEYTSVNLAAVEIKDSWDVSTVTWNTKPSYETSNAVLDYAILNESTELKYIDFDITRLAQKWYNQTANNYGVAIIPLSGSGTGRIYFASSDYHDSSDPHLLITYRDTKGLESIWNYSSHGAGNAGTGYVNGFNGNLVFVHDNMATEGSVIPIVVSHVYNSYLAGQYFTADSSNINAPITSDYSSMIVGKGWKLSIQETINKLTIDDNTYYVYNDADGTELYFYENEDEIISEDGYGLYITKNSNGTYTLSDDYGNEKLFDTSGKLIKITDVHGNLKKINYTSDRITSVTYLPAGETTAIAQLTFSYNTSGTLYKITDSYDISDYVQFYYSTTYNGTSSTANGGAYLRKIEYSNGAYSSYEYNSDGTLLSATDGDTGYTITYTYTNYNGNKRVSLVTEKVGTTLGQTVGFIYGDKSVSVRTSGKDDVYNTSDDLLTTALFDNFGRTICSYSSDISKSNLYGVSYAEYTPYTEGSKANHKIKTNSEKGKTNENLIANSNFESFSSWTGYSSGNTSSSVLSSESIFGEKSLAIMSTSDSSGHSRFQQTVSISSAGTYTLSAYVKTENVVTTSNGGAYIVLDGEESEYILGTTNVNINNGWQRISVTKEFAGAGSYTVNLKLGNASGTAYFDCIQLEKGDTPSEYNMIQNSSIRSGASWNGDYSVVSTEVYRDHTGSITGAPASAKSASQTIALNCDVNTTFMLSGWARANSVDLADTSAKSARKFGLKAVLTYSDNTTEEHYISFNPDNTAWQYASLAIVPKTDNAELTVKTMTVSVCYDYNANTMFFDDICLTVEPAQTYKYDESTGKLETAKDTEGNQTLMEYAENGVDLETYTAVTGEKYDYTYRTVNGVETHQVETASKTANSITQTLTYGYDAYGNAASSTLSNSETDEIVTSSATYTEYGNYLLESIDALGNVTGYNYDSVTKLLKYVEDANSNRTAYIYDTRDRLSKVYHDTDEDGIIDSDESTVEYLYLKNRLSGIITDSTVYALTYDEFGNVLSIKAGDQHILATYEYASNNGKLLKMTYGNGDYEEYLYDNLDRLTEVKYNGITEYSIAYDANGAVYSISDGTNTHIYEYDSLGRLIRAYQKDSSGALVMNVENSYDSFGRAKGSTYSIDGKTLSYTLSYKSESNLVSSMQLPKCTVSSAVNYTYDELDRLVSQTVSLSSLRDFVTEYDYYTYTDGAGKVHTTGRIEKLTLKGVNSANVLFNDEYSYTYDNVGNILTISKNGTLVESYEYDSLYQLTRENNAVAGYTKLYVYDKSGNMLLKSQLDYTTAATSMLNVSDGIVTSYGYSTGFWGDMLTSYNGTTITYDGVGNPLKWRNATALTWEKRELQKVTFSANSYVQYEYNSDGIRLSKSYINPSNYYREDRDYVLDGTKIIKEHIYVSTLAGITNTDIYYVYDGSGSVIGMHYNGTPYYYQKNLQGDVVRIVDSTGAVVVEYTYDAWGKVLTTTGSLASTVGKYNSFRYRSYYYDTETGWYYLQSRYYDPTVCRFLNADAIIGANGGFVGFNMFVYCNNNPIVYGDPEGYDAIVLTMDGIFGHLGIMAQDDEGQWYHFYWGSSDSIFSSSSSSSSSNGFPSVSSIFGWGSKPKTRCDKYNGELTLKAINDSGQYEGDYSRMTYLNGDFSDCIALMDKPKGRYNLFFNNCAQKSLKILASADTIYKDALLAASKEMRPETAHNILLENMPSDSTYCGLGGISAAIVGALLIIMEIEWL